ncbi:hypothetical protein FB451DRAFT_1416120 [Mycena latifolia]|nr:hypothetical protein FB451DRAFT_1416120 [Mycena latifolia]
MLPDTQNKRNPKSSTNPAAYWFRLSFLAFAVLAQFLAARTPPLALSLLSDLRSTLKNGSLELNVVADPSLTDDNEYDIRNMEYGYDRYAHSYPRAPKCTPASASDVTLSVDLCVISRIGMGQSSLDCSTPLCLEIYARLRTPCAVSCTAGGVACIAHAFLRPVRRLRPPALPICTCISDPRVVCPRLRLFHDARVVYLRIHGLLHCLFSRFGLVDPSDIHSQSLAPLLNI